MKYFCFLICSLYSLATAAQTKEKAQQQFLSLLNKFSQTITSQHWAYEDPFIVDTPYHIIDDTLTATFLFRTDSNYYRIRYAASLKDIKYFLQDVYLIIMFNSKAVNVYEQAEGDQWTLIDNRNMFHLGTMNTEEEIEEQSIIKEDLELAWAKLSYWYDE